MSEEIKANEVKEEKKDWSLPQPEFPKLDMPEPPNTGKEKLPVNVSCEGEFETEMPKSPVAPPIKGQPRILIGIPVLNFTHEFVISFMKFWTELCVQTEGKFTAGYYFVYRKPVHMAETEIVKVALFNKCTHILFMDDDIYDVTIADLHKLLEADKDVISGVMHASKFPHAMCVFRRFDVNKKVIDMPADNSMFRLYEIPCICDGCGNGLSHWDAKFCPICGKTQDNLIQKVDLIPFCFTLMKTEIFDRIKKPWFHCTEGYPSDSWFADRCLEAGIQQYAHMAVRLNHNGVTDANKSYYVQMGLEKNKAMNRGMVNLTQEEMDRHQFLLHQRMVEAEEKLKPKVELLAGAGGSDVSNKKD